MNWDVIRFYTVWNIITIPVAIFIVFPVVLIAILNLPFPWRQRVMELGHNIVVEVSNWRNELRIICYLRNRKDLFDMLKS